MPRIVKKPVRLRGVPAVTRAMAILRIVAASHEPLSLTSIAQKVDIIPSTCLHILRVLVKEGMVKANPQSRKYSLGPGLLVFATKFVKGDSFVRDVQPFLEQFMRKWGVPTNAVELSDETHVVVTNAANVPASLSLQIAVGSRYPALISATGRCYAAFGEWTPEMLKAGFAKLRWQSAPTFEGWLREIEKTRRLGYAIDPGNFIRGVMTVSAPIFNEDRGVSRCVSASAFTEQFSADKRDLLCKELVKLAARLRRKVYQD